MYQWMAVAIGNLTVMVLLNRSRRGEGMEKKAVWDVWIIRMRGLVELGGWGQISPRQLSLPLTSDQEFLLRLIDPLCWTGGNADSFQVKTSVLCCFKMNMILVFWHYLRSENIAQNIRFVILNICYFLQLMLIYLEFGRIVSSLSKMSTFVSFCQTHVNSDTDNFVVVSS